VATQTRGGEAHGGETTVECVGLSTNHNGHERTLMGTRTMSEHYVVEYELWPLFDPADDELGRHIDRDMTHGEGKIDAINSVLYYVRGRKSDFEVARIHTVWGPFETKEAAREKQYE